MKRAKKAHSEAGGAVKKRRWPLAVHVVFEQAAWRVPKSKGDKAERIKSPAEVFAERLYERLSSGTQGTRAARIPVRHWSGQDGEKKKRRQPARIPLDMAEKNVAVVLVDQLFFEKREKWSGCVKELVASAQAGKAIVLPVSIQADAARVARAFADVNHIVVSKPEEMVDDERLYQSVYTAILRVLKVELPGVFFCHAKRDGVGIAQEVRKYLYEETQLSCFFDMHDIPHGHPVKGAIEKSIKNSVVLAIWTDRMLESPWCQFEIIEARRQQRPMLVLDALTQQTARLFPYLGNAPVVRWNENAAVVVSAMLLELLRTSHLEAIFHSVAGKAPELPAFGLHPPDVLDNQLQAMDGSATKKKRSGRAVEMFVYPDPPLRPGELEVLHRMIPGKRFLSLIEWQALRAASALNEVCDEEKDKHPNPLHGKSIGISVSASDRWADMGLSVKHQDDFTYELALQLILLGAKVVWGGDLRPNGLGSQLQDIVHTYQHPSHPSHDHVAMYVPYTVAEERRLKPEEIAERRMFAEVTLKECPVEWVPAEAAPAAAAEGRALYALALTEMRGEIAKECDARIVLGGGMASFQGLYPGIAEEACESVKQKRPLYVIGGYGGAAGAVYGAIMDAQSAGAKELVHASLHCGAAADAEVRRQHVRFVKQAEKPAWAYDPEGMVQTFAQLGLAGLAKGNGLSQEENARLGCSQDIHEIMELVVKGVSRVRRSPR
ncbi:TIR domain-containing protein [Prosthecobacter sp.]|uniref:TIR domain-containing protein n=1 Tax=Prosthecobacter sp. TaxID=1965333 RepID=UPI003783E3D6